MTTLADVVIQNAAADQYKSNACSAITTGRQMTKMTSAEYESEQFPPDADDEQEATQ